MVLLLSLAALALAPVAQAAAQPAGATAPAPAADGSVERAAELIKDGKPADALPLLDGLIAQFEKGHPATGKTMVFSASNLAQTIYYSGISAALKRDGIVVDGNWALAYFLKGFALVDLNRSDEALACFDRAIALSPADSQYLAERGEWYKSHKQWDKAFADFKAAADWANLSDDSFQARNKSRGLRGMGFVRIEQGDLKEAEKLFRQSLEVEPRNANALSELDYIKSLKSR
ncbi:MAG TPA: tetratricopeptide repeat protein [Sphingomicrobium sp.]